MEEAISAGNSPFAPEETRRVAGRAVRVLTGMGQIHSSALRGSRSLSTAGLRPLSQADGAAAVAGAQ